MTLSVSALPAPTERVKHTLSDYIHRVSTYYPQDVLSITLYGSQARGDAHPESDIDLFLVVQDNTPTLREAFHDLAWQVQFKHDMVISDIIRSQEEAHQMQAQGFPYYQNIEKEGIVLWKKTASKPTPVFA